MSEPKIERAYHENGQLRWEGTIKDGKPIGWNRHWHENDQLKSESYYVRGKDCGRSRMWWEDGSLMSVNYHLGGFKVSKKKYLKACEKDPTLPRYDDNEPEPEEPKFIETYQKRETPISESERQQYTEQINKYLREPNRGEARQWLKGDENRWLGRMTHEDSLEVIEEGYKAGAIKIIAVDIAHDTTERLVVYVPPSGPERERVFKWHSVVAQKCGWAPNDDWGQNELFVFFD